MTTASELALLPATQGHIDRAKAAVKAHPARQNDLNIILASDPTRGQMVEFMDSLHAAAVAAQEALHVSAAEEQLALRIDAICKAAGIELPSGSDRLAAMQIALLHDQNAILQDGINCVINQGRSDAKPDEVCGGLTELVGKVIFRAFQPR